MAHLEKCRRVSMCVCYRVVLPKFEKLPVSLSQVYLSYKVGWGFPVKRPQVLRILAGFSPDTGFRIPFSSFWCPFFSFRYKFSGFQCPFSSFPSPFPSCQSPFSSLCPILGWICRGYWFNFGQICHVFFIFVAPLFRVRSLNVF